MYDLVNLIFKIIILNQLIENNLFIGTYTVLRVMIILIS